MNKAEKFRALSRRYYHCHREECLAKRKKYYAQNRERLLAAKREQYEQNRNRIRIVQRERYERNRERILALQRERYKASVAASYKPRRKESASSVVRPYRPRKPILPISTTKNFNKNVQATDNRRRDCPSKHPNTLTAAINAQTETSMTESCQPKELLTPLVNKSTSERKGTCVCTCRAYICCQFTLTAMLRVSSRYV